MGEWASATIHLSNFADIAQVFTEQVQAQVVARTQGALSKERDLYKLAAPMGRFWRRKLLLHFKVDSSTLWEVLWLAFKVRHPRSAVYRAAVRQQLRVMNSTRGALAEWARAQWFRQGAEATERRLREVLREIGGEVADVTWHLRPREGANVLHIPWEQWEAQAPGRAVAVYTDARACQDPADGQGSGVGLVTRIGDRWWGAAVPLPPWVDNTTGELLGSPWDATWQPAYRRWERPAWNRCLMPKRRHC